MAIVAQTRVVIFTEPNTIHRRLIILESFFSFFLLFLGGWLVGWLVGWRSGVDAYT